MNINTFIESCKTGLRNAKMDYHIVDGKVVKCLVYEDDVIKIKKSMEDYSMEVVCKKTDETIVSLDSKGHISFVSVAWKNLQKHVDAI